MPGSAKRWKKTGWAALALALVLVGFTFGYKLFNSGEKSDADKPVDSVTQPEATESATPGAEKESASPKASTPPKPKPLTVEQLVEKYKHLDWIDAHYHGASGGAVFRDEEVRERLGLRSTVLFGSVSESPAVDDDNLSLEMHNKEPEKYYPFFAGIDLHDPKGVEEARKRFEQGFYGIGEIAAASTMSPVLRDVEWKAEDPMDGILPKLYKLSGEMKAPLLLHIDPLFGEPVSKFVEAAKAYPETTFILAHANAFNSPENMESILEASPNITLDFYPGFTAYNSGSTYNLKDFVELIKKYPDRFVVSTDSGYDIGYDYAIEGVYRLFEEIGDEEVNRSIARGNLERILKAREQFMKRQKSAS